MKIRTDFVTNSSSSSYVSIKFTDKILSELMKEFSDVLSSDEDIIESFSVDGDTVSFSIPEGWYGNHPKNEKEAKGIVSSIIVSILGELTDAVESIEENHSEFENRGEELITRLNALNKEELLAGCTTFDYSYSQNGDFEDPSLLYELEDYLVGDLKELNYSAEDYYIGSTTTYKDGEVKVHTEYEINGETVVNFFMSDTVANNNEDEEVVNNTEADKVELSFSSDYDYAYHLQSRCVDGGEGAIEALAALAEKHSEEFLFTIIYAGGLANLTLFYSFEQSEAEIINVLKTLRKLVDKHPESIISEYERGLINLSSFFGEIDLLKYALDEAEALCKTSQASDYMRLKLSDVKKNLDWSVNRHKRDVVFPVNDNYIDYRNTYLREAVTYAKDYSHDLTTYYDKLAELSPEEAHLKCLAAYVIDFMYYVRTEKEKDYFKFTYDTISTLPRTLIFVFKNVVVDSKVRLDWFVKMIESLFYALAINEHGCIITARLRDDADSVVSAWNFRKYAPYIGVENEVCFAQAATVLKKNLIHQLYWHCLGNIDLGPFFVDYYRATGVDLKTYFDPLIPL